MRRKETAGRRRFSPEERAALAAEYRQGDLTQREFAAQVGISVSCLGIWLRRAREESSRPGFVELGPLLSTVAASPSYRVQFTGGLTLELSRGFVPEEVAQLCRLMRAL